MTFFINHRILLVIAVCVFCTSLTGIAQKKNRKNSVVSTSTENITKSENLFIMGMKYYMLEDFEEAIKYFQKSVELNPYSAGANYQLAKVYYEQKETLKALTYAQKALELQKENEYYYLLLSSIYSELNELNKAIEIYEQLIKKFPKSDKYLFEIVDIYIRKGDKEKAIEKLNAIEKEYGVFDEISFRKQQLYLSQNKLDKAILEGEKLIETYPEETNYKLALAQLYFSNSKTEESKKLLESILESDPYNGEAMLLMSDIYKVLENQVAANEFILKAFEFSDLSFERKINITVNFLRLTSDIKYNNLLNEMTNILIRKHSDQAQAFALHADYNVINSNKEIARESYLKAIQIDPNYFKIWQQIVFLDSELNDNEALIKHTEQALEFFPNQAIFWYYNGTAFLMNKNYEKGVFSLEKAKILTTENEMLLIILSQLGDTYHELKQYSKSDEYYEKALEINPNTDHVLNNYSYFLSIRNEKLDLAKELSSRLMKINSTNPTYLDTYAWVMYKLGDFETAKKYLEKALEKTQDGTVLEHFGDVLFQLGDIENAIIYWEKAEKTGDFSELLLKKLKDKKLYE